MALALVLSLTAITVVAQSVIRPVQTVAATSNTINFQARLETAAGAIVPDGNYNVEFKLYSASSGGSPLWTEDRLNSASQGIQVANGYLTANLGSITSFPGSINWDQQLWLTMNIGGTTTGTPSWDGEMSPRLALTALPYAFRAGQLADPANSGSTLGWASQTGARSILLPNEAGTLCIQNSTNCGFATGTAASYIQNQSASPQTASFNVTGTGVIGTSLTTPQVTSTGTLTLQSNTTNAVTLDSGTTGQVNIGTGANSKTIQIGTTTGAVVQTINIGTNATASSATAVTIGSATTSNSTVTIQAGTTAGNGSIQIGSLANGITQTINIGTNTNAAQTVTVGSKAGTSPTVIQGGTSGITLNPNGSGNNVGVLVKPSNDTTAAFQIQNSSSASLFNADTSGLNITMQGGYNGLNSAWTSTSNMSGAGGAVEGNASVVANGYIYSFAGSGVNAVSYAKLNANGTVGTWGTTTALPGSSGIDTPKAVFSNGYIYVMGGINASRSVYYAKPAADGTISGWTTLSSVLPSGQPQDFGASAYNGYIYIVGGDNPTVSSSTVYAKQNADGSLGSFTSTGSSQPARTNIQTAVANGYLYMFGGWSGSAVQSSVYKAPINADGTLGTWSNTGLTSMNSARHSYALAQANGYVYILGGMVGNLGSAGSNTVQYAHINSDGTISSWTSSTNTLPTTLRWVTGASANGYLYTVGGDTGGAQTANVYYSSVSRVQIAGSLDLVGINGGDLATTGTGGTLTAGDTNIVGTLQVQGAANFAQGVGISGALTVGGDTAIKSTANSTTAFQIQNSSGTPLLVADTQNTRLYVGNPTADTTGAILVLDTKSSAGDPTGVNGAMYYNSSTNTFRCYQNGAWTDCVTGGTATTLQSAYNSGNTITTTDARDLSINLADTTTDSNFVVNVAAGSTSKFAVQYNGADTFSITNGASAQGSAIFKNAADNTTAFQIQNNGGTNLLTGDTTNMRIQIGSAGTPTSQLFVSGSAPAAATGTVTPSTNGLQDISVQGNYAYTIDYTGSLFKVVDVSNPASPTTIGSVSTNSKPQTMAVAGRYAYVGDDTGHRLDIIDISKPASPSLTGSLDITNSSISIAVSGKYAYVGTSGGHIKVVNISNPAAPTLVSDFSTSTMLSLFVAGRYLYTVDSGTTGTFRIIDISNPASLSVAGSVTTGGQSSCQSGGVLGSDNVYVSGRYAYVTVCSTNTVKIFDVSNPASPTAVGSGISTGASTGPLAVNVQGRYAYVNLYTSNQFSIYDVSSPSSPSLIGTTSNGASSGPMAMAIQGRYGYVADWLDNKLNVYNLGGSYIQQLEVGGVAASNLSVNGTSTLAGDVNIQGGIQVGQNAEIDGDLGVGGSALFQNTTNSTTAFQIQNAAGGSLFTVDSANSNITVLGNNSGEIQSWQTSANAPSSGFISKSVILNGYIYAISDGVSDQVISYAKLNANGSTGAWTTTTSVPSFVNSAPGVVAAGGYIYLIGGYNGSSAINTTWSAKQNPDGSLGAWTTQNSTNLDARWDAGVTAANGYIYVVGGYNGSSQNDVYYAKYNADGTLGNWTKQTGALPGNQSANSLVAANGWLYSVGGFNTSPIATVYKSQLNQSTGATGTWSTTGTVSLPTATQNLRAVAQNGYIYAIGGDTNSGFWTGSNQTNTVFYAKLNTDGTMTGNGSNWWTSANPMPRNATTPGVAAANGYIYDIDMINSPARVYYTSGTRLQVGGSLDLIGIQGGDLNDPGAGGSLTAGNTNVVGNLAVQGQATFANNVTIAGNLTGQGSTLFQNTTNSTTAFQIQNASGTSLFTADTTNSKLLVDSSVTFKVQNIDSTGLSSTITRTNRTSGASATNYGTGSYTPSGTFTPTTGNVLIAYVNVESNNQAMAGDGSDITISGGSLNWVPITGKIQRVTGWGVGWRAFYAVVSGTAPTNMQVTVDAGSVNINKYEVTVDEMSGVDTNNPIAGAVTGGRQSTNNNTWTATLGATPTTSDLEILMGAIDQDNSNHVWSTASGWSEFSSPASLRPAPDATVQYQTGTTSTTLSYSLGNIQYTNADTAYGGFILKASGGTTVNIGTGSAATINIGGGASQVNVSGNALFQPGTDSTTAFQIQASAASSSLPLFTADSSGKKLQVGSATTDANAVLVILDSYNQSSDPTGTNGAMYYNTSTNTFRCYENGGWKNCIDPPSNSSTADQAIGASTTAYLTNSNIAIPSSGVRVGTQFKWRVTMTKTAAGTVANTFDVRFGTNGSTSDTSRCALATSAGTAAADTATVDITVTVRSVGSSATIACNYSMVHNLATTGWSTGGGSTNVTSGTFNDTVANSIIGISFTTGASYSVTVQQVQASTTNL